MKMRSSILRGLYTASITVVLLLIVKRNMNIPKALALICFIETVGIAFISVSKEVIEMEQLASTFLFILRLKYSLQLLSYFSNE